MSERRTTRNRSGKSKDATDLRDQLGMILARLTALENTTSVNAARVTEPLVLPLASTGAECGVGVSAVVASNAASTPLSSPPPESHAGRSGTGITATSLDTTDRIIGALSALSKVRSNNFYISNFNPNINDIDSWCDEVDRARDLNGWDDNECLSRIANCLKGDAKSWLQDWVTHDRSWSNFKVEFKPLCSRRIDIASILFDVMCTNSDQYPTYADYARRCLLRLNIVKGLSDELIVAIVIRGISDPQIRAAATNSNLLPKDLVEFLSIYVKPSISNDPVRNVRNNTDRNSRKRTFHNNGSKNGRCFKCNAVGHSQRHCPKHSKDNSSQNNSSNNDSSSSSVRNSVRKCSFCKKVGHEENECFAKQRLEVRKQKVNFCYELKGRSTDNDVVIAVIQNVPTDVLIDSGSCVSLISAALLKHFNCCQIPTYQLLRGIGSQNVESTSRVTLVVEFVDVSLEIDFLVVPETCMNVPVIVGTDVLNRDGVAYIRINKRQRLTRVDKLICANDVLHVQLSEQQSVSTPLEGTQRDRLLSIITEFKNNLIVGTALSTVNTGCMHIQLTNNTPVHYRPYKLSLDEKIRVRGIIQDLLEKGIIRESESPYASPIILVKKKDGTDRMCVDYRALNAITVRDRYPLPLIYDHIDRLGKHKYFSCLDMATGFHQIRIDNDSVPKTGFVTPEGHYEYLKMPYGLTNAPIVYQRIISKTLIRFINSGKVLVYVDDVCILSNSVDEALIDLREVMTTLTVAGFSINLKKSTFVATEVEYLGRIITQGQVRPSDRKIQALVNSPVPTNVKQVRQLLGLAGYFRRYIAGYASKTAPFAKLTRNGVPFVWSEDQESARKYLIDCMTNEPVLAIFDPTLPTELHTDASSIGYGAVLLQEHAEKKRRVIAYFSKTTQGAEPRYHSYELETLAVVKALCHFRQYLLGIRFKIVTDCNALKLTERKKDLLPRVARWWMYMQDFNFVIEYRKGSLMSHADYLSRNPIDVCTITKPKSWAEIAQSADEETRILIDKLNNNELDQSRYVVRNDLLFYKYTPVGQEPKLLCYIPKGHRLSLLRIFHDQHDHIGYDKTLDLILRHFWFPGLRTFVRKYIKHCLICISGKRVPRAPHQPISSWVKPDTPFSTVHVDALGILPESNSYRFILIIIDAFSKFCLLYAIKRQDSDELTRVMSNAISLFGAPKLIVCDRGRMFESTQFRDWVTDMGSQVHYITPEMHSENGQAERYCRTILNMLRVDTESKKTKWSDSLWKIQLVLNCTKHKTTHISPMQLLIGIEGTTPVIRSLIRDVAFNNSSPNREAKRELHRQMASERLEKNRKKQDARVNERRKIARKFKTNDLVFVAKAAQISGKLDSGMRGPYRVMTVLPHDRYELRLLGGSFGKTTRAAAEYIVPWHGEWTPESCAAFFNTDEENSSELHEAGPSRVEEPVCGPNPEMNVDVQTSGEAVLSSSHEEDGRGYSNVSIERSMTSREDKVA